MWGNIFRISGVHKQSSSLPISIRFFLIFIPCAGSIFIDIHKKTTRQRERTNEPPKIPSFSTNLNLKLNHIQEIIAKPANIFFDSMKLVWLVHGRCWLSYGSPQPIVLYAFTFFFLFFFLPAPLSIIQRIYYSKVFFLRKFRGLWFFFHRFFFVDLGRRRRRFAFKRTVNWLAFATYTIGKRKYMRCQTNDISIEKEWS